MTPKLALTLIVGPGEALELERLLKSVRGDLKGNKRLYDAIWVTETAEDPIVHAVAKTYADMVLYFQWCDDFSKARNHGWLKLLERTDITHKMWLDADDVMKPSEYEKMLVLKENLKHNTIYLLDYIYCHDEQDRPVLTLPRERIYPNKPGYLWHDPIHEYINMQL